MTLSQKSLDRIEEADLLELIGETEGKFLDFKRDAVGASDSARKEFLYDISSFANASGGHIIFGMEEGDQGSAIALLGMSGIDPDKEVARLEQMARNGIRPPIVGLHCRAVHLTNGNTAMIVRIPKSWASPHQVTYQNSFRFYGRDTNAKYLVDVDELRTMILQSADVADRAHSFRDRRVQVLRGPEPPAPLGSGGMQITHVVPLSSLSADNLLDLRSLYADPSLMVKTSGVGGSHYYNLEGIILGPGGIPCDRYFQVFRNGCLEFMETFSEETNRSQSLPSVAFNRVIMQQAEGAKHLFSKLGIEPPMFLFLTLLNMRSWNVNLGTMGFRQGGGEIRHDPLLVPGILVESFEGDMGEKVLPLLDITYNAAGLPGPGELGLLV